MSDALDLLIDLVKKESLTPNDAGCQAMLAERLSRHGFKAERLNFNDTHNIWLRRGTQRPLFTFLGHTDVVPPGPLEQWDSPPFQPTLREGKLYGRGTADMKAGIACFMVAVERFIAEHPTHKGSISLLLTSDEEGTAHNGVVKVIEVLEQRREKIDWCLVGEPSSDKTVGDVIRVGRRGSLHGKLTVYGKQGHIAYPDSAQNPIHRFAPALQALTEEVWDRGNQFFPATRLQVATIHSGAGAENIIPGELHAQFNLRFSTELDQQTIKQRTAAILDNYDFDYDLQWRLSGNPFITKQGALLDATHNAIKQTTGLEPIDDTGGGTSDGRFIAPTGAQVVELGPVSASIHKINENTSVAELESLVAIYQSLLTELLLDETSV